MVRSVFITDSPISQSHGGGNISYHLQKALQANTQLNQTISKETINPEQYGYTNENPFFLDYLAASELMKNLDLAQIYGTPFGLTVEKLRHGTAIVSTIAPHNIEISKREHEKTGMDFIYPHLINPKTWALYTKHLKLSDIVVTTSEKSAEYIKEKLKLSEKPIVIHHGCNLPSITKPMPEEFTVGHLGQNGIDKGQRYLIEAWRKINPKNLHLKIAGDGTYIWNELNYLSNFEAFGRIDDLNEFYRNLSVYVQPSATEGFGIPVLEAMSHARPVIVTEETGASDLVENGNNGFVIPICSPKDIEDKILYFYDNPGEAGRMGRNARKTAKNHTWKIVREKYAKIYIKLVFK